LDFSSFPVKPGAGDPVPPGDLPGESPCGRTNMGIKGWMSHADQAAKVKGMFVRPEQVAEIGKRLRHP
jgi:phenylacetate-CoA ligase